MENEILSKQINFDSIRFAEDVNWERVISPTDEKERQDLSTKDQRLSTKTRIPEDRPHTFAL